VGNPDSELTISGESLGGSRWTFVVGSPRQSARFSLRGIIGDVGAIGATLPSVPIIGAFAMEWLLSFALIFVIMAVATDERVADGFAALAVGLTVGFCAMMGGH
jgi:glycerol uptake facilitator-like aquaporin